MKSTIQGPAHGYSPQAVCTHGAGCYSGFGRETLAPGKGGRTIDIDTLLGTALQAMRVGAFESARSILEAARHVAPDHPSAWAYTGAVEEALGHFEEAARAYERAIAIDESDQASALALARLYVARGDRARAEALLSWLITEAEEPSDVIGPAQSLLRSIGS